MKINFNKIEKADRNIQRLNSNNRFISDKEIISLNSYLNWILKHNVSANLKKGDFVYGIILSLVSQSFLPTRKQYQVIKLACIKAKKKYNLNKSKRKSKIVYGPKGEIRYKNIQGNIIIHVGNGRSLDNKENREKYLNNIEEKNRKPRAKRNGKEL